MGSNQSAGECHGFVDNLSFGDVNESKAVAVTETNDGFTLDEPSVFTSCQKLPDPYATFCQIPGWTVLSEQMCAESKQSNRPDALFERVIRGELDRLDKFESIWESSAVVTSSQSQVPLNWDPVSTAGNVATGNGSYLGLRAVPNTLRGMAVGNDCLCLHVVFEGQLFTNSADGVLRKDPIVKGRITEVQYVQVCSSGRVRVCLFEDKLFFFTNNKWNAAPPPVNYSNLNYATVKMWEVLSSQTVIYISVLFTGDAKWGVQIFKFQDTVTNAATTSLPFKEYGQINGDIRYDALFLAVSPNNDALFVGTRWSTFPEQINVHRIDTGTFNIAADAWTVFTRYGIPRLGSHAVCFGSLPAGTFGIRAVVGGQMISFAIRSDAILVYNVEETPNVFHITESLNHSKVIYWTNQSLSVNAANASVKIPLASLPFALDDNNTAGPYIFAFSPNGTNLWIFRNGILFRIDNIDTSSSTWSSGGFTSDFNLLLASSLRISDFGLPSLARDVYVPSKATHWFMGTTTKAREFNLQTTFPFEIGRSKHETFRYMHTGVLNTAGSLNKPTFPYAKFQLERANEYVMGSNASNSVWLCNDGNLVITESRSSNPFAEPNKIIWQSHMHDRSSFQPTKSVKFKFDAIPQVQISSNGIYILHITNSNRLRLVFNTFNSERFAKWCASSTERLGKAVDTQMEFCWNNLKLPASNTMDQFVDDRCSCLGGKKLFDVLAPNTENIPQGILGPLQQNMPCIMGGCARAFDAGDTQTNASNYVAKRCAGRVFNICQDPLTIGAGTTFINVPLMVTQNCTINSDSNCTKDSECGINTKCVNGKCLAMCTSNEMCESLYGLQNGMNCVDGTCQKSTITAKPISLFLILTIIAAVILLTLMITFVVLFAQRKSKTQKRS